MNISIRINDKNNKFPKMFLLILDIQSIVLQLCSTPGYMKTISTGERTTCVVFSAGFNASRLITHHGLANVNVSTRDGWFTYRLTKVYSTRIVCWISPALLRDKSKTDVMVAMYSFWWEIEYQIKWIVSLFQLSGVFRVILSSCLL